MERFAIYILESRHNLWSRNTISAKIEEIVAHRANAQDFDE